jgi:hypothetical protein
MIVCCQNCKDTIDDGNPYFCGMCREMGCGEEEIERVTLEQLAKAFGVSLDRAALAEAWLGHLFRKPA